MIKTALILSLVAILSLISWIDLKSRRVPNILVGCVLVSGFVWCVLVDPDNIFTRLLQALIVTFGLFGFTVLYAQSRKSKGLGAGDIKLFGALAVWFPLLPFMQIMSLSFVLFVIAAFCSPAIRKTARIPFAPFITVATGMLLVAQNDSFLDFQ